MIGARTWVIAGLSATLLLGGAPAAAEAAAYSHFVGCGLSTSTKPSHACAKGSKKGAFFKSSQGDVAFSVCLRPPTGASLCAYAQRARQGVLKVNRITATVPGRYRVTWFIDGTRVGSFSFRVTG